MPVQPVKTGWVLCWYNWILQDDGIKISWIRNAIHFLLSATPSLKVLSCGTVTIIITISETEMCTIVKYCSLCLFGTFGVFLLFLTSVLLLLFSASLHLALFRHHIRYFVHVFSYPEWITADPYGSDRVTNFHKMTCHSVKLSFAVLVGRRSLSLRNTFSHFIHPLNADLEPGYVLTLCSVTAYYDELQSYIL